MNKAELIDAISALTKASKTQSKIFLEAFMESVSKSLKKGNRIVLTGFGTFSVAHRKARKGINPSTGKSMVIKAKKVPHFKPGKNLRKKVS